MLGVLACALGAWAAWYGEIVYRYAGRAIVSRSTGPGEVLPIIYEIAGITPTDAAAASPYPGYPVVADAAVARIWFYLILPLLIVAAWAFANGRLVSLHRGTTRANPTNTGDRS